VWEEHRLPFKHFVATFRGRVLSGEPPLDPAKIASVGFLISDQQDGPFQLEISSIKAAGGDGKPHYKDCFNISRAWLVMSRTAGCTMRRSAVTA